jgi:hypothetical protein
MRQNRVTPDGEIIATPARGLVMGNRGCLHDAGGQLGTARWRHNHWLICLLAFKGRRRPIMAPNRWTELFFLDEATALAAGHRPCAECRRPAFEAFRAAFAASKLTAPEIDRRLHAARVTRSRRQITHVAPLDTLPDGAFVRLPGTAEPLLVKAENLLPWHPEGYGPARPRPTGPATVLTPAPTVAALRNGYRPLLHPSATPA